MSVRQHKAKQYSLLKYLLATTDAAYLVLLLLLSLVLGVSKGLASFFLAVTGRPFAVLPLYLSALGAIYFLVDFPLRFYQSYVLEHQFCLSRQQFPAWLKDELKSGSVTYVITLVAVAAFYALMKRFIHTWWLAVSLFWVVFTLVLARLVPIVIIPLFFTYGKLTDEALKTRILSLAQKMRLRVMDVFTIDLSSKTLKANAALVGWGKTRRVLLADTILERYTHDEIEVIMAHEFAHHSLRHMPKLIAAHAVCAALLFLSLFLTGERAVSLFGFTSLWDVAALPVILLYFLAFGLVTQLLLNCLSRRMERKADLLALQTTGLRDAFISMMEKISLQNLADRDPHPLIKVMFFDHPPIEERIALVRGL